ncbi:polyisoprenoid-binding protein [Methylovulum psychrotolerans]|uniref:Polyisoprenoid-binding protein n=2 Tax=Methylovulum psychrotolerans TaxID=1704499 RepID=A0A1Z4C3H1_9GAMM|nr:polyisoprenoid-binding protein [Methylovulum psychrotolerans]
MQADMHKFIPLLALLSALATNASAAPQTLVSTDSHIGFTVKEMGVPVAGQFKQFTATISLDPLKPEQASAEIRIDIGSLSTGTEEADAIALSPDWLDKAHAPVATFKSVAVRALGDGDYLADGVLSIRNQNRDLSVRFHRAAQSDGKTVITGDFVIKRSQFGIGGGLWNEEGVVAEEIPVNVRLTLAAPAQ